MGLVSFVRKDGLEDVSLQGLVVYDKDNCHRVISPLMEPCSVQRQTDRDIAAGAQLAVKVYLSPMLFNDTFCCGESEPESCVLRGKERFKDLLKIFACDTPSGVTDGKDELAVVSISGDCEGAPFG